MAAHRPDSKRDGDASPPGMPRGPLALVLLGVVAAALIFAFLQGRREVPERETLALHDNLMGAFRDGEWVRATGRINLGTQRGQRHTVEAERRHFSRAVGVLSRPEGKPPFAWMVGDAPVVTLDILEPADRVLEVRCAKGVSDDVQNVTLVFNGHELPSDRLPKNGKLRRLRHPIPSAWQRRGTNTLAFRFDRVEVRRLADQPGELPLAGIVSTVALLAPDANEANDANAGSDANDAHADDADAANADAADDADASLPVRAGVQEVAGPGGVRPRVVLPTDTSARAATFVPQATRAVLRVMIDRLDVPFELSLVADQGKRTRLGSWQPGETLPFEARFDLSPWRGRAVVLDAWARGTVGAPGEVHLSRVALVIPEDEQARLLATRGALGLYPPVGTWALGSPDADDLSLTDEAADGRDDEPNAARDVHHAPTSRPEGGPERPSFLLVVLDSLTRRHVGAYGASVDATPVLDDLVRRGIHAVQAMAPASYTLPSVGSLLTGQEPLEHGVVLVSDAERVLVLRDEAPSLAGSLGAAGWRTRALVTNPNAAARHGYDRGFQRYDELFADAALWDEGVAGVHLPARLAEFLSETGDAPFLAYVHVFEPHAPYDAPDALRERFVEPYDGPVSGTRAWIDSFRTSDLAVDAEGFRHLEQLYTARVALADAVLGQLLETLAASGRADDTVVVVVSDHGEGLGEHDTIEHGDLVHGEQIDVPLVIAAPWLAARALSGPVTLGDVAPTILGLARVPAPDGMSGVDLLGERLDPRRGLLARNAALRPTYGWTRSGLRLVVNTETRDVRLFDLLRDPGESQDVKERHPAAAALMGRELLMALEHERGAASAEADAEHAAKLQALGYLAGNAGQAEDGSDADPSTAQRLRQSMRRL